MAKTIILPGVDDTAIARWLHQRLSDALDQAVGEHAVGEQVDGEQAEGEVAVAVPGGATPFPILAELGGMELDWRRLAVWPGDDRAVPEDHPASNIGKIRALLEPRGANVVALTEHAVPPHFALVWLGMGNDGHVASLFPNTRPRADDPLRVRRITPDPLPPEAPFDRLSLTIPALLDSDEIVFVIRGEGKRALFEQAMAGGNKLPVARLLRAARQPVTCFT